MNQNQRVVPGDRPLTIDQLQGLAQVAWIGQGRDVILAIDLTSSVGFDASGKLKLSQIILNSLKPGDLVHIITFSNQVNLPEEPILITSKSDLEKFLADVPLLADPQAKNTDIQQAELSIYSYLAQLNQSRLYDKKPIFTQSIVWVTDAPLDLPPGIRSEQWIETPKESPFRQADSNPSQERIKWLDTFIRTTNVQQQEGYQITIVDIPPQVQESCTLQPGGSELCLVDSYIHRQLLWPTLGIGLVSLAFVGMLTWFIWCWQQHNNRWNLKISFGSAPDRPEQSFLLKSGQRIAIGTLEVDPLTIGYIDGIPQVNEVSAYLERRGVDLYIIPLGVTNIELQVNGTQITKQCKIQNPRSICVNCHHIQALDYELLIRRI